MLQLAAGAVREGQSGHGEGDRNPGWMIVNCPRSCDQCEMLDPKKRCGHGPDKFTHIVPPIITTITTITTVNTATIHPLSNH